MSDEQGFDPESEREVDLRSAWSRIRDRWWLPVGGALLGAVLGVLVAVGGGQVWEAKALLYLGQPFTPTGGGQIQSLQTNPKTVSEIIRSETALRRAAERSELRLGQLRGNITSKTITQPGSPRNLSPLVEIVVQAPSRSKSEEAANSLVESVVEQVSTYVDEKIELLTARVADDEQALEAADRRVAQAIAQQQEALTNTTLSLTERLLLQSNANATLNFLEARQTNLRADLNEAQQLLSLAQDVERSRVVQAAAAKKTEATSRRNAALVGALIGLIVGAVAAYIADPLLARRRREAPA